MGEFKITAQVIGLAPDADQITGERYTQVNLAVESFVPRQSQQQIMTPFPVPRPVSWKFVLNIFIPLSQWRDQYKMWQKYDLIIKDTGELTLKQPE